MRTTIAITTSRRANPSSSARLLCPALLELTGSQPVLIQPPESLTNVPQLFAPPGPV